MSIEPCAGEDRDAGKGVAHTGSGVPDGRTPKLAGAPDGRTPKLAGAPDGPTLHSAELLRCAESLGRSGTGPVSGTAEQAQVVDQLRALEVLKSAACAAQARLAVRLDESVRKGEAETRIPAKKRGFGVAAQVALARRESPHRGRIQLGLAKMLVREMPHTLRALSEGALNEWRATVIVRETACLSLEDRAHVDEQVCGDAARLDGKGDRQLAGEAKAAAIALDVRSVVSRSRKASAERTVTCRPAPDTMVYLSALLPVAHGVAAYKALGLEADRCRAVGDARSRGQIMADTLVERVTGQSRAGAVKVELQVVMTDRALFQGDAEPARLNGYGVVPAQWARDLVRLKPAPPRPAVVPEPASNESSDSAHEKPDPEPESDMVPDSGVEVWLRRLYTAPTSGQLMSMDSRARAFTDNMRRFIAIRDVTCRRPWCDAPIRHHDHVVPFAAGGATSVANAEGLCEACNYSKDAAGWSTRVSEADWSTIVTTTPAGRSYTSPEPATPGKPEPGECSGEVSIRGTNPRTLLLRHLRRPRDAARHRREDGM